jgi:hypothetical protein
MTYNLYKFFDYFGLLTFSFLLGDALVDLSLGLSSWRIYTRLIIGVGGLLIDGYLVFFYKK